MSLRSTSASRSAWEGVTQRRGVRPPCDRAAPDVADTRLRIRTVRKATPGAVQENRQGMASGRALRSRGAPAGNRAAPARPWAEGDDALLPAPCRGRGAFARGSSGRPDRGNELTRTDPRCVEELEDGAVPFPGERRGVRASTRAVTSSSVRCSGTFRSWRGVARRRAGFPSAYPSRQQYWKTSGERKASCRSSCVRGPARGATTGSPGACGDRSCRGRERARFPGPPWSQTGTARRSEPYDRSCAPRRSSRGGGKRRNSGTRLVSGFTMGSEPKVTLEDYRKWCERVKEIQIARNMRILHKSLDCWPRSPIFLPNGTLSRRGFPRTWPPKTSWKGGWTCHSQRSGSGHHRARGSSGPRGPGAGCHPGPGYPGSPATGSAVISRPSRTGSWPGPRTSAPTHVISGRRRRILLGTAFPDYMHAVKLQLLNRLWQWEQFLR